MKHFVGIDWAHLEHAVCVLDQEGGVKLRLTVKHSDEGFAGLISQLKRIGTPSEIPIALERPSGLLVDALARAGFPVVPIHPNVVKASRPRYSTTGNKSDRGDAYLIADLLRTDGHRFRPLLPLSDEIRALRALVRTRDDLVAARISLANQLRCHLETFWPGAARTFNDVASNIALAFLERYPTPAAAARLGEKRLAAFLKDNGYCGRKPAGELLERLRSVPVGKLGEKELEAKATLVQTFINMLRPLMAEIYRLKKLIEEKVEAHAVGRIISSFPRAGRLCAGQILAELGEDRAKFASDDALAAEAGVAPVTYASGKTRGVAFRHACNKRLRQALVCFSDNSRHASEWAADVYKRARARGCDHPHAIRVLARAWVRVLWRCWKDGVPYDPKAHEGAKRLEKSAKRLAS
jgi:transposase